MTSFNTESHFLDLKQTYQNFEYEELLTQSIVAQSIATEQSKEAYQGMTQNTYLFVQQKTTLIKDIQNLAIYFSHKHTQPNSQVRTSSFEKFPFDKIKQRVCFIFQKYQQQPTLLDTLLEQLIKPLMDATKDYLSMLSSKNQEKPQVAPDLDSLLMIVYQLTKVRGKKWVIQYFPHEVKDLYPALKYLSMHREDTSDRWESQYVILLWLGVIAMVPFNLDIIDTGAIRMKKENGQQATQIVEIMIEVSKIYLRSLTKTREAAAMFLSKIFTRPDIQKRSVLPDYIKYVIQTLKNIKGNPIDNFFVCGLYESLHYIFKRVQRSQLLPLITDVLEMLKQVESKKDNAAKKELKIKLLTQIGLTYLKPRNASWAYYRKSESLQKNLQSQTKSKIQTNTGAVALQKETKKLEQQKNQQQSINADNINQKNTQQGSLAPVQQNVHSDIQYYRDVNKDNLQLIIDMLVQGLTEKQTTVREDAAKGIGKIAGRLSQDMVLDILDYILDLKPSPQVQHAICLTIAELIRRNLIPPEKLEQLYPLMRDSLVYEQQEGGYSVGQAVRDASCYMVWSVARAYAKGGYALGINLMITACFDRQVGCRRASSAAYQQLVGRTGDVPNGIQILTQADYFTLGPQKNAYLNVSLFVASYKTYFKPMVEHLCYQKLRHWDLEIKRISACSLSLMCPINPVFMANEVLPSMIKILTQSDSMNVKLGAIIGLGEMLLGMKGLSHQHQLHNEMKDSVFLKSLTQNQIKLIRAGQYMEKFKQKYDKDRYIDNFALIQQGVLDQLVKEIIKKIEDGKLYKGKAGENFRIYTCRLIECLSVCGVSLSDSQIATLLDFIEQNIKSPQQMILQASVKCIKQFVSQYHQPQRDAAIVKSFIEQSKNVSTSRCFSLALSKLSSRIYQNHFDQIFDALERNTIITKENNDPEKRKYAVLGIVNIFEEIGFKKEKQLAVEKSFEIFFRTVQDYTTDKRGDIGSIVRQASMTAIVGLLQLYVKDKSQGKLEIQNKLVEESIAWILQQLLEKIDRIRLLAGSLLQKLFDQIAMHFTFADQEHLTQLFCQKNIKVLIKEAIQKIDSTVETRVMEMQIKIQQTIALGQQSYLIYFWNVPHAVYPLIVPLLGLETYSYNILKGLITSTGGISESIIKYSLNELGGYLTKKQPTEADNDKKMSQFFSNVIRLMKSHFRQERIIVPLFKTLDFILQKQQVIQWPGLKKYDTELFYLVEKQIGKLKNIAKVSASTGLYVHLLSLNNEQTLKGIKTTIVNIICSDLPKSRKLLSDKLLFFLMSQEQFEIFDEEQTQQLMTILSENDFVEENLNVDDLKIEIKSILGMQ